MKSYISILLFFYLVAFPFGQLFKIPFPFLGLAGISISICDFIVGLISGVWLVDFLRSSKSLRPPYFKEFTYFGIALLFSFLLATSQYNMYEILVAAFYLIRLVSYGIFYFAVWRLVHDNSNLRKLLTNCLVVLGTVVAVFGLFQYLFFPDMRLFIVWGWDEHYMRLAGTFLDPGFTSIILVFSLVLLVTTFVPHNFRKTGGVKLIHPPGGWISAVLPGLLIFVVFSALVLTYSRAGYVSLIAGAGALALVRRQILLFILPVLFLLAGIISLSFMHGLSSEGTNFWRTTSSFARFQSWEKAIKLWKSSPVFGVGFNFYKYALSKQNLSLVDGKFVQHGTSGSDSSLLFILATTGVVGFIAFLYLLAKIFREMYTRRVESVVILSSLIALLVHSVFLNSFFYPHVLGWIAALLALNNYKSIRGRK